VDERGRQGADQKDAGHSGTHSGAGGMALCRRPLCLPSRLSVCRHAVLQLQACSVCSGAHSFLCAGCSAVPALAAPHANLPLVGCNCSGMSRFEAYCVTNSVDLPYEVRGRT